MFNLLGSSPSGNVKYLVYMTKIAKYRQLMEHLQQSLDEDEQIHLVAHFDQTLEELKQLLDRAGMAYNVKEEGVANTNLVLSKSEWIKSRGQVLEEYKLVVAELYPTTQREDNLKSLQKNGMTIYCALDNPFFELLGGERIRSLMGKLGLRENESIEHPMVTKAIQGAQQKMNKRAKNEKPASTMREWMALHMK